MLARCLIVAATALSLQGCAAVAVPALGAAAMTAGAEGAFTAVRAGTEYRAGGVAFKTFALPRDELRGLLLQTLDRLQAPVVVNVDEGDDGRVIATAAGRTIDVTLEPLTPVLTRMRLIVEQSFLRRDRATASELISQLDKTVAAATAPPPSALPRAR